MKMTKATRPAARPGRPAKSNHTAQRVLDVAERLVQTRGYNGFSYADIALELKVTKASLHYHFASKGTLGAALIDRYHTAFTAALAAIDRAPGDAGSRLKRYVDIYDDVIHNHRMCLCGMLAAEHATLPAPMQTRLQQFFDINERWLTAVLEEGRRAGLLEFHERPAERAAVILGALEGAMLVARSYDDPRRFRIAADHILQDVTAASRSDARRPKSRR